MKLNSLIHILIFGVAIILASCSGTESYVTDGSKKDSIAKSGKQDESENKEFMEIHLNINHKPITQRIHRSEEKRFRGIESTANCFLARKKNLDSVSIDYVDFTGDGKPEKVVAHVFKNKKEFVVTHIVTHGTSVIWTDTLDTFDPNANDNDWYDKSDTEHIALEPYASFYDGFSMISLVLNQRVEEFNDNETPLKLRKKELEKRHLSSTEIDKQLVDYKKYIQNFKGKLLAQITEVSAVWIWYEPEKKFVELYEP